MLPKVVFLVYIFNSKWYFESGFMNFESMINSFLPIFRSYGASKSRGEIFSTKISLLWSDALLNPVRDGILVEKQFVKTFKAPVGRNIYFVNIG